MKKLALVAIMLLIPFSAFALDAMNDSALDEITAQEGVTITFDNVVITQAGTDLAWGDGDGVTVTQITEDTNNDGVIDENDAVDVSCGSGYIYLSQDSGNTIKLDGTSLTIDVATANQDLVFGDATIENGTTFIAVGLPSVTIGSTYRKTDIYLASNTNETEPADEYDSSIPVGFPTPDKGTGSSERLGSLYQNTTGDTTITGRIYIYAH